MKIVNSGDPTNKSTIYGHIWSYKVVTFIHLYHVEVNKTATTDHGAYIYINHKLENIGSNP